MDSRELCMHEGQRHQKFQDNGKILCDCHTAFDQCHRTKTTVNYCFSFISLLADLYTLIIIMCLVHWMNTNMQIGPPHGNGAVEWNDTMAWAKWERKTPQKHTHSSRQHSTPCCTRMNRIEYIYISMIEWRAMSNGIDINHKFPFDCVLCCIRMRHVCLFFLLYSNAVNVSIVENCFCDCVHVACIYVTRL